ncbi:hypothetical protein SAMN05444162_4309 [Paenibacillaceae bacterium GAS479]|nr:hypothetical protein SAMN05444162_4309 [Paenibacillaceae bacterium GAS479]
MPPIQLASISSFASPRLGVILVLFILLVIVTRILAPASTPYYTNGNNNGNENDNGDNSLGILGSKGFTLENRTRDGYTFVFIASFSNARNPTPITPIPNGRNANIEVNDAGFNRSSLGEAWYDIHFQGNKVGDLRFGMSNRSTIPFQSSYFYDVFVTPGFAYQTESSLTSNPVLRIRLAP